MCTASAGMSFMKPNKTMTEEEAANFVPFGGLFGRGPSVRPSGPSRPRVGFIQGTRTRTNRPSAAATLRKARV